MFINKLKGHWHHFFARLFLVFITRGNCRSTIIKIKLFDSSKSEPFLNHEHKVKASRSDMNMFYVAAFSRAKEFSSLNP